MNVQHVKARLLSPLTYHSVPDAGAAGATVTAPVLGDIALSYALHYALDGSPLPFRFGGKGPDYAADYVFLRRRATVGVALGEPWEADKESSDVAGVTYLPPEFAASSFVSEGYEQKRISSMESKHRRSAVQNTPYRTWRQIQSLAPGNVFGFAIVGEAVPPAFTIRMGLQRGCLIQVQVVPPRAEASVNRFTVEHVLGRTMPPLAGRVGLREAPLAHIDIQHGVPSEALGALLGP